MAKTSLKVKQARPQKYKTREYNRCKLCGRPHAYIQKIWSLPCSASEN